jgi:hypothetical protein
VRWLGWRWQNSLGNATTILRKKFQEPKETGLELQSQEVVAAAFE